MPDVDSEAGLQQQQQQGKRKEQKKQGYAICFCVQFDAAPSEDDSSAFRGVMLFHSPAEILVPLKNPLEQATLSDLHTDFVFRASRRFPHLANRVVEAFFISTDGDSRVPTASLTRPHLLRLDLYVNRDDTLDNFFTPVSARGPKVYDIIAHWDSSLSSVAATTNHAALTEGKKEKNKKEKKKHNEVLPSIVSDAALSAPLIYPFTQRCVYAKLMPHEEQAASAVVAPSPIKGLPQLDEVNTQVLAKTIAVEVKNAARKARRDMQAEELTSRKMIMKNEGAARGEINEIEEESRRQTVILLRLMCDEVPKCGVTKIPPLPKMQKYPVDTKPLISLPPSVCITDLSKCAEETAWLSYLFAKKSVSGSAFAATKVKKKDLTLSGELNNVKSNKAEDKDEGENMEFAKAREELIQHYAYLRRDLLMWERKIFRDLTTEMRSILAKQKQLDEEILRAAFLDELSQVSVLDFSSYTHHYSPDHLAGERDSTPDTVVNCITDRSESSNGVSSVIFMRPTKSPQPLPPQTAPEGEEGGEKIGKAAVASSIHIPPSSEDIAESPLVSLPTEELPRSSAVEDEYFREALERSKARAKSLLDSIALIDMRWHEPITFKLTKHRLSFDEKGARKSILSEESECWDKLQRYAQEEKSIVPSAALAQQRLLDPVIKQEEQIRADLDEQQERRLALLRSLYRLGMERLERLALQQENADV